MGADGVKGRAVVLAHNTPGIDEFERGIAQRLGQFSPSAMPDVEPTWRKLAKRLDVVT